MNHLTELAESNGLVSPDHIAQAISGMSKRKLAKLAEETLEAVIKDSPRYNGPEQNVAAKFLASSSLRGDSGCRAWRCRAKKLEALARYVVLYADGVLLPISAQDFIEPAGDLRFTVGDFYFQHSILRPLFDGGLAHFVDDLFCVCYACAREFESICRMHERAARDFYLGKLDRINIVYRPPLGHAPWYVEITGPEDYIEHGQIDIVPFGRPKIPAWAPKRFTEVRGQPGALLSQSRVRRNHISDAMFAELSSDAVFQQFHGVRLGATYLTDSALEAEFLERVYPREHISDSIRTLLTEMQHAIPLLSEVPLRKVMSIRKTDYESFRLYRTAISSIVKDHLNTGRSVTPSEARELCSDVLLPQILRLKIEARAKTRSAIKKSVARAVVPAAMLTVGLISGLVPRELSEIFKVGGIALSGQLAEAISAIEKNPAEIRNQNMYFLMRLCQIDD